MFVLDSHCDTPSQIIRLRDLSKDNLHAHVDFPKLKAGGVDAAFFALYTPGTMEPDSATRYAFEMLSAVHDAVKESNETVKLAYSAEDAMLNKSRGLISIFTGMENGLPIQHNLSLLRLFRELGVSYVTLTHNTDNQICDSAASGRLWHGLSPFGKKVVKEMNRLGMIIDIAHASDETFYDCLKHSEAPIVSTHSCCRALASHRRNMSDDMIKALSLNGGVIQINFYPLFLSDEFAEELESSRLDDKADIIESEFIANPSNKEKYLAWVEIQEELAKLKRPSYKKVVDHIEHAIEIAGIDHVGIGSDFDGINVTPKGLENISKMQIIFDELRSRGYSEGEISKVAGENFLRVMKNVSDVSNY